MSDLNPPIEWAWEGELESPIGQYATRGPGDLPRVGVAKPLWRADVDLSGAAHAPATDGQRHGVGRFAFALNPTGRQLIQRVEFTLNFKPVGGAIEPLVIDLAPKTTTETKDSSITLGLEPKLKTAAVEVSGPKAGYTINLKHAYVTTRASGVQQAYVQWVFEPGSAQPLVGDQIVQVELQLAAGVMARAQASINVDVVSQFGLIKGLLPRNERQRFNWVLQ